MAAAAVRNLLLLLLAVLGLAAPWPTHAAAYKSDAPTGSAPPMVVGSRRVLAVTNAPAAPATPKDVSYIFDTPPSEGSTPLSDASVPLTPADSGELGYAFFEGKGFMAVGESSNVTGRIEGFGMISDQVDFCSQFTVTLETSDPALQCTPGPFPLRRGGWDTYDCHLLSETPSEGPGSLVPFTGPIASCTAVGVAADPVLLTVTVRMGGRVFTQGVNSLMNGGRTLQLVVITATPVSEADVNVLVSPKQAVADAKGSALFQVTVTGLVNCSLATLTPRAGGWEGSWCRGPTDLVPGPNGTCTTKRPIRCRRDLEGWEDDGCFSPHVSSGVVTFDVVPNIPDDPRVVNGWGFDTPYPRNWACLVPKGTKPVTPPSEDGGTPVMPPDTDAAAAPAASTLLPPLSDKAATNSPADSVVVSNETPATATSSAPTTQVPVGSGTPTAVADKASGGAGAGPVDVAAAPAPAAPSDSTASSSLSATSVTMGPSSDSVPAMAPVAGPDPVAGLNLEAGTLEGGPNSIGAVQKPAPVVQSNTDISSGAYQLDGSAGGASKGSTQQQRSPGSRASVTAGYCWFLGAVLVLMAAW